MIFVDDYNVYASSLYNIQQTPHYFISVSSYYSRNSCKYHT